MTMGQFPTIEAAIDHAKRMGGWIAHTFGPPGASASNRKVYWFDAAVWQMTPIMLHPVLRGLSAMVAPWTSHQELLDSKEAAA